MKKIFQNNKMYLVDSGSYSIYYLTENNKDYTVIFDLIINSDFSISANNQLNNLNENGTLELKLEKDNLFYGPFITILGKDNTIVIEHDITHCRYGKKVNIKRNKDEVIIKFEYLKAECLNEFSINIKNVMFDLRSETNQKELDIEDRIHQLFADLNLIFKEYEKDNQKILKK